ncbi:MAG TPA: hypothetical protein VJ963_09720, partial [Bacteroidales bacterium]|nr:hypothetical protein [Bacteroidales bacterium]
MKNFLKIFVISFLSLLGVLILIISILTWIVFTPGKLTPLVRKQAEKYITCKSDIGSVELTFFSTFPEFGLKVNGLTLINPVNGAGSDTLLRVDELVGIVDAKALWKKNDIILVGLEMNGGLVNIYSDSLGNTNYNIVSPDSVAEPPESQATELPYIDIKSFKINDVNLHYADMSLRFNTLIHNLGVKLKGVVSNDSVKGDVKFSTSMLSLQYGGDSLKTEIRDLEAVINGIVKKDSISGHIIINSPSMSLEYVGEKYL